MPLQATISKTEFDALPDTTVLGKDSFVMNGKTNEIFLNLPDQEASKLAFSMQDSVKKLTENNKELLTQKNNAAEKNKAWEALGKTPEEIAEDLKSKRPEDIQALVSKHNQDMETTKSSFQAELDKLKDSVNSSKSQLQNTLTQAAISKLRNEFNLNDTADYVLRDFIKAEPKDEGSSEFAIRVYQNGEPAKHLGEPMTPDQLINGFREQKKFPAMFNAGDGGGSGQGARQVNIGGGSVIQVSREASKSNPSLYQAAKAQAEKTGATVQFTD